MPESRRSRTRTLPPNDQQTTDHPDDTSTVPADPDADTQVVAGVTHYHGGERDFHRHGLGAHHHVGGRLVDGAWAPPGVKLWEYVGFADVNEHRHDDRHTHSHDPYGQQEHFHNPSNNAVLPLPADGWPVEYQPRQADAEKPAQVTVEGQSYDPAEVEASQARHPSGREPADEALPSYAAEIERQLTETRAARDRLDAIPTPQPPATPVPEGISRPGTSIAHPGALNLLNTVHHIKDDGLNHEMTWLSILLPLAVEIATYHADNRAEGGTGPELAPIELLMRTRDALEHIVLPRLAREREGRP